MPNYFFDTSALVKRYAQEAGSAEVIAIIEDDSHNIYILDLLTCVEVNSALKRKVNRQELDSDGGQKLAGLFEYHNYEDYLALNLNDSDIEIANMLVWKHSLRAYDAVQLATCIALHKLSEENQGPEIVFVSADNKLVAAAQGEGLNAINPGQS